MQGKHYHLLARNGAYFKGHLLKEGCRDLLYYTVLLFVPPLILKVNLTFSSNMKRYMFVFFI